MEEICDHHERLYSFRQIEWAIKMEEIFGQGESSAGIYFMTERKKR
jgi:hypothetical protein